MSTAAACNSLSPDDAQLRSARFVANMLELLVIANDEFERDRDIARASLSRVTVMLRGELQRHTVTPRRENGGELAPWQVRRLRSYIDANLGGAIRVKDLSRVVRRSTGHFCRAFKRSFGQTPHAYVTARRLELAQRLMLESEEQLSVIATLCGFTDQAHLSKLFRRHLEETPGGWRRRHLGDGQAPPASAPQ